MNSRRTSYGYASFAAVLMAGCLYARGISHPLQTGESARASLRAPSLPAAIPLPEDTTHASPPAEKVYKNVQVLRGMSAEEFMGTLRQARPDHRKRLRPSKLRA